MRFVHLHTHSYYSMMRGTASLEALCSAMLERGMDTFALTDTNGIYGLNFFLQIAEELGIRPIVGAELRKGSRRAVVLVKDGEGYANMCRILTDLHCEPDFSLVNSLRRRHRGLFVLSDCQDFLARIRDIPDAYLELIPGRPAREKIRFAREAGLPLVATNDVHFIEASGYKVHRLLRAIDLNTKLCRIPAEELALESSWLRSPAQMMEALSHCPDAVENALDVASRCRKTWRFGEMVFPESGIADPSSVLRERCYEGARKRYESLSRKVVERIEHELSVIEEKGFAQYFLVVQDMVSQAPRTCGRGSAAASIVSYCLGITHVDPIAHNLLFERFLNPGRKDAPDIDVDFPWDERDEILEYVFRKYGKKRAAMVGNHNSFRARAAIREVAKVYGLSESEIKTITGRLADIWTLEDGEQTVRTHPKFRGVELKEPWPEVLRWARRLEGFPRNMSVHCGGVVIVPDEISRYVPVQPAPKGVSIIQWEKDQTEDSGLVKIDLLGNRSLAVIRDALRAIEENYGTRIDYADLNPLGDPETLALLASARTIGVFYVESPAMRQLQAKTGVGDFEHLVIHSSIIRPAANTFINEYVRRLRGAAYKPLHPSLGELLSETHGIMCYQEDVTKAAMAIAGFDVVKADGLRKALSKKRPFKRLARYRREFYRGALDRGVRLDTINRIWEMIMSFSGYSFCKAHSASFALVSFKSAYIKAHYPAEFIAAVISNQGGYYSTFEYVSEAKRMGLRVLLPDINESKKEYTGKGRQVRVGLMQLKGLSERAMDRILAERERGRFSSLEDFMRRVPIDPSEIRMLVKAGCFDSVSGSEGRPGLMWKLHLSSSEERDKGGMLSLFEVDAPPPPSVRGYDEATVLRHEVEVLGFLVSRHPLSLYQERLGALDYVEGEDLAGHVGERVKTVGWLVTGKTIQTRTGQPMEFVSFEDTTGIYETTFFPDAYGRFSHMLETSRPYILTGKVESDMGAVYLLVENVEPLDRSQARPPESKTAPESVGAGRAIAGSTEEAVSEAELELAARSVWGNC
ncbi:MAG: DNA polymerase III subunit alpha [bacterium]